jgi:uncharacterized protein (DUF2147 family)
MFNQYNNMQSQRKKNRMPIYLLVVVLLISSAFSTSVKENKNNDPNAIIGTWKTGEGNGMIKITRNGDKFQGQIVWIKDPNDLETGKPMLDKNHPDKANHTRQIMGLTNMWGFKYTKPGVWEGGKIYDPKKGSTYECTIKLKNDQTIEVRGYVGISLIGRTDTWTRQADR